MSREDFGKSELQLQLQTNPGLRAPATTFRSSRGTGRVGVDTYLSRCRHGRAGRVLRVGVSVCGRWGCWAVDWGVVGVWCTACGRVRRATWSPSCLPCHPSSVLLESRLVPHKGRDDPHVTDIKFCTLGDRLPHVCRLRSNIDHFLRWTAEVNFGLKRVGTVEATAGPGVRSDDASMRPEAPFHASAAAFPTHVAPVAVC